MVEKIVVLGTGGTIAGLQTPGQGGRYRAGQVPVGELLADVSVPTGWELVHEQVAQVDSKDMDWPVWQALLARSRDWLAQSEVRAVVITHGTDTLEETAWLLHSLLAPAKPLVLTCAMRPADAPDSDGPGNLRDALIVAADMSARGAGGVVAVCAGRVMSASAVQKMHSSRLDAFDSGEAGDLARVESGRVEWLREPMPAVAASAAQLDAVLAADAPPRVEVVMNYAAASGATVDALCDPEQARRFDAPPVRGLVVAGTGGGTVHQKLEAALRRAQAAGVRVVRSTRCADGWLAPREGDEFPAVAASPVKARVSLMLELLAAG